MRMKFSTNLIWTSLHVLSWIIFVGLCIQTGAFLTNAVSSLVNPGIVDRLWQEVDLSALFAYDHRHFFVLTSMLAVVTGMKAWLFFVIINMFGSNKLDFKTPFVKEVQRIVFILSILSFFIGVFSAYGGKYTQWLSKRGIPMSDVQNLLLDGADVWIFMSIILFIIAQIFKRGVEIQNENELTI